MKDENIKTLLNRWSDKITPEGALLLKNKLVNLPDERVDDLMMCELKNPVTLLLFSIFLGGFGVDQFMLGNTGKGVCKLLFGWLTCYIWWLVDVITITKQTKKYNETKLLLQI